MSNNSIQNIPKEDNNIENNGEIEIKLNNQDIKEIKENSKNINNENSQSEMLVLKPKKKSPKKEKEPK